MSDSVALVVLDTLRKDAFDEHFDWLPGRTFEQCLSPSHWTTPVHGIAVRGRVPQRDRRPRPQSATRLSAGDAGGETLAERLDLSRLQRYGNVSQSTKFDRGFDEFMAKGYHSDADVFDWTAYVNSQQGIGRYPGALWACLTGDCDKLLSLRRGVRMKYDDVRHGGPPDLTAADVRAHIRDTSFGDQEFLLVNLMEAHDSYAPPPESRTVEPPDADSITALAEVLDPDGRIDSTRYRQAYEDSVRYLAKQYRTIHGDLLENFEYVITVSDHGEAFGEDVIYGHIPSLLPDIVHVPLSIAGSDVPPGESHATVNLLDVHRTITDITGVQAPPQERNLLDAENRPTMTEAHGIGDWQRTSLEERGLSPADFASVTRQRRGIATKDYYGYDSIFEGWVDACGETADQRVPSPTSSKLSPYGQRRATGSPMMSDYNSRIWDIYECRSRSVIFSASSRGVD